MPGSVLRAGDAAGPGITAKCGRDIEITGLCILGSCLKWRNILSRLFSVKYEMSTGAFPSPASHPYLFLQSPMSLEY